MNEAEELGNIREGLVEETSRRGVEFRITKAAADRRKPTEGSCGKSTRKKAWEGNSGSGECNTCG